MKACVLFVFAHVSLLVASWDYTDPQSWGAEYPTCDGARQSPIDIVTDDLVQRQLLPLTPVFCPLQRPGTVRVSNVAYASSFQFDFEDIGDCNTLSVFQKTYKLAQMHFHWGPAANTGTEHSINGITYPAELHAVHYDASFPSIGDAIASGNGDALAVVGYMFSESATRIVTKGFHGFFDILAKFQDLPSGENTTLTFPLALDIVLPRVIPCYAHYEGSLTTPGCNEQVLWFVASEVYEIPQSFLSYLRRQRDRDDQVIVQNGRPIQQLGNRSVYTPEECTAKPTFQQPSPSPTTPAAAGGVSVLEVELENSDDHGLLVAILVLACVGLVFGLYAYKNAPGQRTPPLEDPGFVRQH
jgi:carbonic anhydrase